MMDNIYEVLYPRIAVDDSGGRMDGGKVDLDDLLSHEFKGVVRTDGPPAEALMPLPGQFIGGEAMNIIQYLDSARAQSLGLQLANQGLEADQLYKETATRFEGVQDENFGKIELVGRNYSETGFKQLYEGVIWLAQRYQDEATEIEVLGEPLSVDPSAWKYEHYCFSNVGLGAGDSAEMLGNLSSVLAINEQLIGRGSVLADDQKIYNVLDDMLGIMGKADTTRYFNNPEVPESTLFAMAQGLMQKVQMLEAQLQENPLAEAEMIKAQARLVEAQSKGENEMKKFILEYMQENEQFAKEFRPGYVRSWSSSIQGVTFLGPLFEPLRGVLTISC